MARIQEGRTSVSIARKATVSLRTTIPAHVTRKLNLTARDQLEWDLDKVDGVWVATIRKIAAAPPERGVRFV